MATIAFGYPCQECGRGTVRDTVVSDYRTQIKGQPFTVSDAHIGVCDRCKAEHFAAQEMRRWSDLFDSTHVHQFLTASAIQELRANLGLPMEQFALLVGCTRQSVHNWERSDRKRVHSRMADLLLKLVAESREKGKVDVLSFLLEQAQQLGAHIKLRLQQSLAWPALVLRTRCDPVATGERDMSLAADTDTSHEVAIVNAATEERVGRLTYDFKSASLQIEFSEPVEFDRFDAEVHFSDGSTMSANSISVQDSSAILLSQTQHTDDDVERILIRPPRDREEVS